MYSLFNEWLEISPNLNRFKEQNMDSPAIRQIEVYMTKHQNWTSAVTWWYCSRYFPIFKKAGNGPKSSFPCLVWEGNWSRHRQQSARILINGFLANNHYAFKLEKPQSHFFRWSEPFVNPRGRYLLMKKIAHRHFSSLLPKYIAIFRTFTSS